MRNARFASDNAAGVHPAVLRAITAANEGGALAYGHDAVTASAVAAVRRALGRDAEVFFVWGGTAANVLALRCAVDSYHAVLCGDQSHLWSDECAAPERFLGCKLQPVPSENGKLTASAVAACLRGFGIVHHAQPKVLSVTQSTEAGTVYGVGELRELADLCRRHDMLLHVDGARLSNAAVALDTDFAALTRDAGVDLLSLGGTKNGLMSAEAVVFWRPELAAAAHFYCKQGMQLASKMRFVAAQIEALLRDDLWRTNAARANAAARRLADGVTAVKGVEIVYPVQTNAVFARISRTALELLWQRFVFHVWSDHPDRPVVRWMTAFDTSDAEVDELVAAVAAAAPSGVAGAPPR